MRETFHEFYGYRIACTAPADAEPVVRRLFGPPSAPAPHAPWSGADTIRLSFEITDVDHDAVPPPYFPPHWDTRDEIVLDTRSSTATVSLAARAVHVRLARSDLGNPIVWGRWLVEKAFLIMTLRSNRHYGLHAGALEVEGRGALVTADSGVGKSTFTAWGLFQGATFIGEDAMMRHIEDPEDRFWGYPRCGYLDPAVAKTRPELADAPAAPVPARDKCRLEWPASFEERLVTAVRPHALLILTRDHQEIRPVGVDEVVELCRSDFEAGKLRAEDRALAEDDLRARLASMALLEFGLSSDLKANYARLATTLQA
ncbi:hypothetical protein K7472_07730 [Streptomyces sp. PTM05]|uniref:HPr kinase n=1 Tax=Streptantibioticus parmotrematis TaxID=2873249 RepID=A0ABS7QPZ9_9ACTN|nr:hypothetical protein [Streptantibioticus parmotrematis]MBY8884734.1 hypothetical protein [Streptantibioticus parmotrematis]